MSGHEDQRRMAEWVDEVADAFEAAWQGVQPPRLEDFLGEETGARRAMLRAELEQIDRAYRARMNLASPATPELAADGTYHTLRPHESAPVPGVQDQPVIPGYEILSELGCGGMGVVYKARQIGLKRVVALKVIRTGVQAGAKELARFRAEAEAAARLQHPNVAPIYEVGEWRAAGVNSPMPYFSMEFVDGGSLDKQLAGTPRPARPAAQLIETLARAVQAAHEQGVVHRDLKPANVLLTADGTPKIADFGLAKRLPSEPGASAPGGPTQSGDILGTPRYMAPEQASGHVKEIGPLVDVYALGVMLYELLTGRPPFQGESVLAILEQVRSHEPVPPKRLQPRVPRDLETICLKAMEKLPARRYASAGELADDLRRFLNGETIQARPVGKAEKVWHWCWRNPLLTVVSVLAAAAVFLTVTTLAISFVLVSRSRDAAWHLAAENNQLAQAEREQREAADQEKKKAKREAAHLALERGWNWYDQQEGGRGLLWLARGLELAHEADDTQLIARVQADLAFAHGQIHVLRGVLPHQAGVRQVAFNPDGRTALTVSSDGTVRLWNIATGRELFALAHPSGAENVAFYPDGKAFLTGDAGGQVRLWDAASGRCIGIVCSHQARITSMTLSPDGKTLLSGGSDGRVQRWDATTGRPRGEPLIHGTVILSIAFSPDGQIVATGSEDGGWRLWDAATGTLRRVSPKPNATVWGIAFAPDGQTFLTAGADGHTQRWDAATGQPIGQPLVHQSAVIAVAISPDGQTILTGSQDTTARLWKADSGKPFGNPLPHQGMVRTVCFSPDGKTVLTGSQGDHCARLWEVSPEPALPLLLPHTEWVGAVTFSPDGQTVLTGCWDGTARLWDAASGKPCGEPLRHPDLVVAVAFSPDGRRFVTAGNRGRDKTAWVWDMATRQPTGVRVAHCLDIRAVAFNPDGKSFLTASEDRSAALWDVATGQCRLRFSHANAVLATAFSPDGKWVVTGSQNNQARLWDAATGQPVGRPLHHQGQVQAVAFHPNGQLVLTGSADGTARLWDTATGQPRGTPLSTQGAITAVAFSPDGQAILTGSYDGKAQLWDMATGQRRGQPFGHPRAVRAVAFSPDGRKILTGSEDRNARLWNIPAPVNRSSAQFLLWAKTITGLELDHDGGLSVLGAKDWEALRERLRQSGDPALAR